MTGQSEQTVEQRLSAIEARVESLNSEATRSSGKNHDQDAKLASLQAQQDGYGEHFSFIPMTTDARVDRLERVLSGVVDEVNGYDAGHNFAFSGRIRVFRDMIFTRLGITPQNP